MDKNLLCEFYDRYRRELYLYIFSLCRNHELSEDILQETFLKAILSLPSQHTNVRAWLYLVARNLCFNFLKKEKHRTDMDALENASAEEVDVIEKIIDREEKRTLYKALQNLESRKREVLILQYFSGLRQKEIASVLHLTAENVRVLGYRGKREIKKYMEERGYDI